MNEPKCKNKFYFQVTKSKETMLAPLEVLELSTRPYNSLKRIGVNTVGDLIEMMENLRTEDNLLKAGRNIGKNAANEIMVALWLWEVRRHGNEDEQDDFVDEILGKQSELKTEMIDMDQGLVMAEISRRKSATVEKVTKAVRL